MLAWLNGKKTYVVGFTSILGAVVGAYYGQITWPDASKIIETALIGMTIRHGISTETGK